MKNEEGLLPWSQVAAQLNKEIVAWATRLGVDPTPHLVTKDVVRKTCTRALHKLRIALEEQGVTVEDVRLLAHDRDRQEAPRRELLALLLSLCAHDE